MLNGCEGGFFMQVVDFILIFVYVKGVKRKFARMRARAWFCIQKNFFSRAYKKTGFTPFTCPIYPVFSID